MRRRIFGIVMLTVLIISGCSTGLLSENLMNGIKKKEVIEVEDLDSDSVAVTDFGVRLFQASHKNGENTLLSPLSVMTALAMTANGAKENTLSQMESVLGMKTDKLNAYLYSYTKALPQGEKYKLSLANSIWFTDHERFTVNEEFLQLNADYYGADVYRAPFNHSTVKDINNWVNDNTDGMIPKIIDEIPKGAVMYLANALAFDAEWAKMYEKYQVDEGVFTLENQEEQTVDFMYSQEGIYLEDKLATGFVKYYYDYKYAFVALLPKKGTSVSDYVNNLTGEQVHTMLANRQETTVKTAIPKFESEYSVEMSDILSEMGMTDAFDEKKANFTGLGTSTAGNIFINRVLHQTYISVGEKGTKAGAVTIVETNDTASPDIQEPKKVYLDRPFVYMLIDCETNIPFFIGTMMDME